MSIFARNEKPVEVWFGREPGDSEKVNCVLIKPELTLGDLRSIERASFRAIMPESAVDDNGVDVSEMSLAMSSTEQTIAQLRVMVVDWHGPMFEGVPYSRGVWDQLNAARCHWWIELVSARINELNRPPTQRPTSPNGRGPEKEQADRSETR